MLDDLNELKVFERIAARGSMTTAARELGLSLAVVSKRLATLEKRVGLRLVNRTTRSLHLTEEGNRLLADINVALEALKHGEEKLLSRRNEPTGHLRVTSPVSFGQRYVVPVLAQLAADYAQLSVALSLSDRLVDVTGGEVDVAIRIGTGLANQDAVVRKLADNTRIVVASPDYLRRRGVPEIPQDLTHHELLRYGDDIAPWRLYGTRNRQESVTASARLRADSGDAVHTWCLSGCGIMLRSEVDVSVDLATGRLRHILPEWNGGHLPVVALLPSRLSHLPLKTRVFTDMLAAKLNQLRTMPSASNRQE
ncbi:LysR family transcriptional regulator [Rahnella sp. SAP-1]|uniref:LysR family transcriptional regulator n=2 Tax=Rouxiella aceris TaxID=2703884 RepID=A0A848MDY9_9GAMM|nr:LysR family transcriptional regulator [Rouxiella aceris]NMP25429.1 LysR family transcriptional regulator [Rouxiella aceris]